MSNASDGARIKVWPGIESTLSTLLNGGGGSGYVKNVTYQLFNNTNNDWSIEVNQCYGQSNATLCELYPVRAPPPRLPSTSTSCRLEFALIRD